MSNVLDDKKQQQILGLGRLGWSLRPETQYLLLIRVAFGFLPVLIYSLVTR